MESPPKKLLDQLRDAIRLKHYSDRTEQTYVYWIRRFILFHHKRHPQEMGVAKAVKTTMIYTQVLNRGGRAVRSPLDS
jgi:hypothetical protein